MPRQRLTWRSKQASPPPQVPTVGQTEEPSHPAYYPDPEVDQYQSGDTSSWAEDPKPGPYPTPGSIPPALPGNFTTEDVDHPAFMLKQASFRRQAQERARVCVRIASALLPRNASEDTIERKALDLMDFDTKQLRVMMANLLRQADDEDDDDEDEDDDDEAEETASKKASKKSPNRKAAKRAEDEEDEDVEDDEEEDDEDYTDEEEKQARKKAASLRLAKALKRLADAEEDDDKEARKKASLHLAKTLQRFAEEDEEEGEDEEEVASKKAASKRRAKLRLAEKEEEEEEEVASKRASLRLARSLRRMAAEEEEVEEVEEEDIASKKAFVKSRRLAQALTRIAEEEEEKEKESSKKKASMGKAKKAAAVKRAKLADARQRKAALSTLKHAMKSSKGRRLASEFFGMDEGELRSCMRAEEADIMSCEMESADLDGDGVDQDSPFLGYSDQDRYSGNAMMDDDFMDDDMGMIEDDMDMVEDDMDDDMDLVAMLRSISAGKKAEDEDEDEDEDEEDGVAKEAMMPRAKTPQNGDGGNVDPDPVPKTPQVAGPMVSKAAADPMGLMDSSSTPQVSDADLDMLFGNGGMSHLAEEETEEEEEPKASKTAGRKRVASRGPKTLGAMALSPKTEPDEITKLSQLWDSAPDIAPLLRRR